MNDWCPDCKRHECAAWRDQPGEPEAEADCDEAAGGRSLLHRLFGKPGSMTDGDHARLAHANRVAFGIVLTICAILWIALTLVNSR